MAASKRVAQELEDLQNAPPRYLRDLFSDDANVLLWHGLLLPDTPPYNLRAFKVKINFPPEYPFKPPKVAFATKIYHPNVGENGQVCLSLISSENWKPSTKTSQVLEALVSLLNRPELGQPLRAELADQLAKNPELFQKKAKEFTLSFGEKRPA
ncbi:ubiquitin/ISG15-conjugating enzyme E2 L6 [Tachyglossus aculeatus]|uniref:ubiquitin/ISG15-conjugating enzyme E2 L6 n=1 Tax=Tachyglossus aculeatus TaxID=9261 RepID=UPI0018F517DF|nr:ubiquitin/ISG15-conjugating enzyme E2 L6 [Tachyglossus aculeatus]